jgi:lysophospholipase L1-like esterase
MQRHDFIRSLASVLAIPLAAGAAPAAEPFNVLVLGDSIAWGQGLKNDSRWRTTIVDRLAAKLGRPVVEVPSELHSGASIGLGDLNQIADTTRDHVAVDRYAPRYADANAQTATPAQSSSFELSYLKEGAYAGEIPSYTPTVLRQLDDYDAGPSRDTRIDLILLSAGINDVGVTRLLDPIADRRYVREAIRVHCHDHLVALLDRLRARFVEANPNCIVIVLSYYPMIGDDSVDIPPVRDLVRALLGSPVQTKAQARSQGIERGAASITATTSDITGSASRYTLAKPGETPGATPTRKLNVIARALVAAANRFFTQSEAAIDEAVADANRAPFSPNFVHVTPNIDPLHTVFTYQPDPQLWSLKDGTIAPEDELVAERYAICDRLGTERHDLDPSAISACRIASIGHPNVIGAEQYADSIWNAILARLPKAAS